MSDGPVYSAGPSVGTSIFIGVSSFVVGWSSGALTDVAGTGAGAFPYRFFRAFLAAFLYPGRTARTPVLPVDRTRSQRVFADPRSGPVPFDPGRVRGPGVPLDRGPVFWGSGTGSAGGPLRVRYRSAAARTPARTPPADPLVTARVQGSGAAIA